MTLNELTEDQKFELKQNYLTARNYEEGVSYAELANADLLVTDAELEDIYGNTTFTDDDFSCSAGN